MVICLSTLSTCLIKLNWSCLHIDQKKSCTLFADDERVSLSHITIIFQHKSSLKGGEQTIVYSLKGWHHPNAIRWGNGVENSILDNAPSLFRHAKRFFEHQCFSYLFLMILSSFMLTIDRVWKIGFFFLTFLKIGLQLLSFFH